MAGSGKNGNRLYQCLWRNRHATRSSSMATRGLTRARATSVISKAVQDMVEMSPDCWALGIREGEVLSQLRSVSSFRSGIQNAPHGNTSHHAQVQLDEYQQLAARTLGGNRTHEQQLANAALGLTGEAGEVAEVIKKHLFHATPLDKDAIIKEL